MNLNIALNTIIYIMVFLFPGVLFRRFYFSSKHKNQFNHGNLFERFLTTIIFSIVCIFFYTAFFEYFLSDRLGLRLINKISYADFLSLFKHLGKNEVPTLLDEKSKFKDFTLLLISIYITSASLGILSYKLIITFGFDKMFSILRFNNEWDYLFSAPTKDVKKKKTGKIIYTNIDILTKVNSKEVLYQGSLYKVLYNKDNDLESIAIRNTQKFITLDIIEDKEAINYIEQSIARYELTYAEYRRTDKIVVYIKTIESDIFVINKSEIINYNILYITKPRIFNVHRELFIKRSLETFTILTSIPLIVLLFISNENPFIDTIFKKIIFSSYSFLMFGVIRGAANNILIKKLKVISNLLVIALFGVFYLWFFDITNFWISLGIGVIISVLIAVFGNDKTKGITQ